MSNLQPKTLFKTDITDQSTADEEGAGRIRMDEQGNLYRWMQNLSLTEALEGDAVHYMASNNANVKKSFEDGNDGDILAGIVMATDTVAINSYCWVQIQGYNATASVFNSTDDAGAVGDTVIGVTTASELSLDAQTPTAAGTAPVRPNHCILAEVATTATTSTDTATKVWVNCNNQ